MKKFRWFIWLMVFLFISGCADSKSPGKLAKEQAGTIMESVLSNDVDRLKALFLPSLQNSEFLDAQIADFMAFIDGNIVSYSEPNGGVDSATVIQGETVIEKLAGKTRNIETDTGKTYMIYHYALRVNTENPEETGVYYIGIVDLDTYDPNAGYPDTGKAFIGQSRNIE